MFKFIFKNRGVTIVTALLPWPFLSECCNGLDCQGQIDLLNFAKIFTILLLSDRTDVFLEKITHDNTNIFESSSFDLDLNMTLSIKLKLLNLTKNAS